VGSDIRWEIWCPWLFHFRGLRAYDYTKWDWGERLPVSNYALTFSFSEKWSVRKAHRYVDAGHNVAVVFDCPKHELPPMWYGMPVIDGDETDWRYDDPVGVIVGLAAKGTARSLDVGGFVQSVEGA
jgi:hypothetical protein